MRETESETTRSGLFGDPISNPRVARFPSTDVFNAAESVDAPASAGEAFTLALGIRDVGATGATGGGSSPGVW